MLVLALLFVPVLALPVLVELSESWNEAFFAADCTIWAVFAVELVIKTMLAPRRLEYLRSHWFDVLLVVLLSLPRFPGHLDCGDSVAQGGVRDGNEVPSGVPSTSGRAGAAA